MMGFVQDIKDVFMKSFQTFGKKLWETVDMIKGKTNIIMSFLISSSKDCKNEDLVLCGLGCCFEFGLHSNTFLK